MPNLKAVLGPTNTGKTHYAIERMLGHRSGMIGLPLRLLAREVFDKIVARKGPAATALITGEERIWPETAQYLVCTVEAMPVHHPVAFMAIDEIQLAEDTDRGHIFTDRLLHARGTEETLLLGAETMRTVLHELDLGSEAERRERFSELSYAGPVKVTKLPKRSAIVAFSSEQVYAVAELLRRQKGGAAVIMGALSPRTRNAQVELYQSGEVDYLVATDAIGMGLNLDVDHIAFAAATKFDGRRHRPLRPSEMAQIAGRAGRFRNLGTFGETGECKPFEDELVRRIEAHTFEPVSALEWRNSALDLSSLERLMVTLAIPSGTPILRQNPNALDEWILRRMAVEPGLAASDMGEAHVRRLWDLCRLPDFRKAGHEGHFRIVQSLYDHLADPDARLSDVAMANRMERLADPQGDISALQQRLAAIRTWTYAAYCDDWLENPELWRDKARALEDRLSDALHEALTERFVDRRTRALLAGLKKDYALMTELTPDGQITVEGHVVGRINGLVFEADTQERTVEGKAVRMAAQSALGPILVQRFGEIVASEGTAFDLNADGNIIWQAAPIAKLVKGADWLSPNLELIGGEGAPQPSRDGALEHLAAWLAKHIAGVLPCHTTLNMAGSLDVFSGHAKGIAFRLVESGAAIDLREDDPGLRVETDAREALKAAGIRTGRHCAHVPTAQKPAAQRLISLLRGLFDGVPCPVAPDGAGSFALDGTWPDAALLANGYLRFGPRAVRADLVERLAWEIAKRRKEAEKNLFAIPPEVASIISSPGDTFPAVLKGFGLVIAEKDAETGLPTLWRYGRRPQMTERQSGEGRKSRPSRKSEEGRAKSGPRKSAPRHKSKSREPDPDSPFAALAALIEPAKPAPKKKKKRKKPSPNKAERELSSGEETRAEPKGGDAKSGQSIAEAESVVENNQAKRVQNGGIEGVSDPTPEADNG
jgi:ATP-dependent RNA helicase SUPV3L1/SUV3